MNKEIRTTVAIGDEIVKKSATVAGFDIYTPDVKKGAYDETETRYFCKDGKVIFQLELEVGCGQNIGFVSSIKINGNEV